MIPIKWNEIKDQLKRKFIDPISNRPSRDTANRSLQALESALNLNDESAIIELPDLPSVETIQNLILSHHHFHPNEGQTDHLVVPGSVFYPSAFSGVYTNPVVNATVEIFRPSPLNILLTWLPDINLGNGQNIQTEPTFIARSEAKTDYQGRFIVKFHRMPGEVFFLAKITKDHHSQIFPLVYITLTNEFFPVIVEYSWQEFINHVDYKIRKSIGFDFWQDNKISKLANAIFRLATPELIQSHMMQIDHVGQLFIDHKSYIWQLEKKFLRDSDTELREFVPLPNWQPVENIPDPNQTEKTRNRRGSFFQVARVNGIAAANSFLNPIYNKLALSNRPKIPHELHPSEIANFKTADELAIFVGRSASSGKTSFHLWAHASLGGPFFSMMTAAASNLFWPLHALFVDIYDYWLSTKFTKYNLCYHIGIRMILEKELEVDDDHHSSEHTQTPHPEKLLPYLDIFTITLDLHLWHSQEREIVYGRDDRPFDPVFDPHTIYMCHQPEWVHFSHWKNLSMKYYNETTMLMMESAEHNENNSSRTKKLIHCDLTDIKSITDVYTGKIILLGKDTNNALCLMRPLKNDCNCCEDKSYDCYDIACKVTDFDFAMKKDGTIQIMVIEMDSSIFTVFRNADYNSNDFETIYTNSINTPFKFPFLQIKAIKDSSDLIHAFVSTIPPIVESVGSIHNINNLKVDPDSKAKMPTHRDSNIHPNLTPYLKTMFRFCETQNYIWSLDPDLVSRESIGPFSLQLFSTGRGVNTIEYIHITGINTLDNQIYHKKLIASKPSNTFTTRIQSSSEWVQISNGQDQFKHLSVAKNLNKSIAVFAIAIDDSIWHSKMISGYALTRNWQWNKIEKLQTQERNHRGIYSELDYTGCIKLFVFADDNFIYMAEQLAPDSDDFIGWLNI